MEEGVFDVRGGCACNRPEREMAAINKQVLIIVFLIRSNVGGKSPVKIWKNFVNVDEWQLYKKADDREI